MERYEDAYVRAVGDLKAPLPKENLARFIENLFPEFPHTVSSLNVKELLEAFGRDGSKSKGLQWLVN